MGTRSSATSMTALGGSTRVELRSGLTDEMIDGLAAGNERVADLVRQVRTDLDRYLRRIERSA